MMMFDDKSDRFFLFRALRKMMFKVAFHGGLGNFWNALMTVPEVKHDDPTSCA